MLFLVEISQSSPRFLPSNRQIKQVTGQVTEEIKRLVSVFNGEMSRRQLQEDLTLKSPVNFEERYLKPALEIGLIEPTIPLKPKSRLQRCRLTKKGKQMNSKGTNS